MIFGEPSRRMLREDRVSIRDHVEYTVVTFDQLGFQSQFLR